MRLKGILDFSLGNFLCLRGFAPFGVLQAISKADESYQRIPNDPRLREIRDYLSKGEFLFFPEVIFCAAVHDGEVETEEINEFWLAIREGRPTRLTRASSGLRLSSAVSRSRKSNDIRAVQFYQTGTLEFSKAASRIFSRIDGNHRLAATTDENVKEYTTPFCIVLCRNLTEFKRFSRALFHNINYQQVPLSKEQNLRLILDDTDLFPDSKLKEAPSFGWSHYLARQLRRSVDFDLLSNLKPIVEEKLYSFFADNLEQLLKDKLLSKNEKAIQQFKKAMSEVNGVFDLYPKLQETRNVGLLSALIYYQLKSPRILPSFVRWVEANNIYLIRESNMSDLVSIFDRVLQSRNRTIFVSMPYGKEKSEEHYAIIERVAREVSASNELQPPLKIERVDWFNDGTSYSITDKINEMISDCGLLVGNLTYCNPNVYHEIGYVMGKAKAEGKDLANILLFLDESVAKKDRTVAFNLHGLKQLRFTKPETEFARDLRQHLERFFQMK